MGAGRNRFQRGPSFTKQFETYSSSTSSGAPASSALRSALAMALRSTFSMCLAARFGVYFSVSSALCAFCPRIRSITSRAFCGDMRTCRASACASIEPGTICCPCAMAYPFGAGAAGAAAPGAAPPAGATPAAFSSAAFTPWPLNERVGENSPSLCPIICSVTYTGINFLPLCTAMVCPIISGTIVERRDQVFTTFFSLRVFNASTFSRKWPSTNGPFFNERAMDSLFLHPPQAAPLRAAHFLEPAHRSRNAMRLRAERADKARALRVRNALNDYRPSRLAQLVQHRLRRSYGHPYRARWLRQFGNAALRRALYRPAAPSRCSCSCRSHHFCLTGLLFLHRPVLLSVPCCCLPLLRSPTSGARQ